MGLLKQMWACLHTNPSQRAVGVRQTGVLQGAWSGTPGHRCSRQTVQLERRGPALTSPVLFCYSRDHPVNGITGLLWAKTNPFSSGLALSLSRSLQQRVNACCLRRKKAMEEEGTMLLSGSAGLSQF